MGFGPKDAVPFPMEKQELFQTHLVAKVRVAASASASASSSGSGSGSGLTVGVIDIVKEACGHLAAPNNSHLFLALTLSLLCPLSTLILLSHALLPRLLATAPHSGLISTRLAETLLFHALCLPALAILWLPTKAAVLCTLSSHAKPTLGELAGAWCHMAGMGAYTVLAALGLSAAAVVLLFMLEEALGRPPLPGLVIVAAKLALGTVYAVLFAHVLVIGSLAGAVAAAERRSGAGAFQRALLLMKGKTQLALLLYILPSLGTALVETVFQYLVLGALPPPPSTLNPPWRYTATATASAITTTTTTLPTWWYPATSTTTTTTALLPTWLWAGPLLVLAYSFLFLFDATMSGAFYHSACKSSSFPMEQCETSCAGVKRVSFILDIDTIV